MPQLREKGERVTFKFFILLFLALVIAPMVDHERNHIAGSNRFVLLSYSLNYKACSGSAVVKFDQKGKIICGSLSSY